MKRFPKTLIAVLAGMAIGAALTAGTVAVEVGASGTSTTSPSWYGCLSTSGALSKVGTVAPTCTGSKKPISWNSYPANANGQPQCTGIPHAGIDLSGCDLQGVDLAGVDLTGANLSGSDLLGSTLAFPNGGGETNFTDANLSDANLTDDAPNTGGGPVNFTGANLTGAKGLGTWALAWLQLSTWSNTTCPDGSNSNSHSPGTCVGWGI